MHIRKLIGFWTGVIFLFVGRVDAYTPSYVPNAPGASSAMVTSYVGDLINIVPKEISIEEGTYLVFFDYKSTGTHKENFFHEDTVRNWLNSIMTDVDLIQEAKSRGGRGISFITYSGHTTPDPFVGVGRLCLPGTCGPVINKVRAGFVFIEIYNAVEMQAVIKRESLSAYPSDPRTRELIFKTIRGEKVDISHTASQKEEHGVKTFGSSSLDVRTIDTSIVWGYYNWDSKDFEPIN